MRIKIILLISLYITCFNVYSQERISLKKQKIKESRLEQYSVEFEKYFSLKFDDRTNYFIANKEEFYFFNWLVYFHDLESLSGQKIELENFQINYVNNKIDVLDTIKFHDFLSKVQIQKNDFRQTIRESLDGKREFRINVEKPVSTMLDYVQLKPLERIYFFEESVAKKLDCRMLQIMQLDLNVLYDVRTGKVVKEDKIISRRVKRAIVKFKHRSGL